MSNTSTLALLVMALLATTAVSIPFGYRPLYSPYHCGSYASRLYSYYSGRPLYTCPNFYPPGGCHSSGCGAYTQPYGVPYTQPYIGNGHHTNAGAGPININNMNSVKIGAMNGAAFPATNANPAEQTTPAPMPETETTATDTGSMAAQSGEGNALQKRSDVCYTCITRKVRKVIYALPSCMGFGAGNCPYSRKMITPIAVPHATPASNNIMINNRNDVVVNMPAMQPQHPDIEVNMPTQPAAPAPVYMAPVQPAPSAVAPAIPANTEEPTPTETESMPSTVAPAIPVNTEEPVPTEIESVPSAVAPRSP